LTELSLDNPHKFNLENKYYTANLQLHVLDLFDPTVSSVDIESFEGIILIPHEDKVQPYIFFSTYISYSLLLFFYVVRII